MSCPNSLTTLVTALCAVGLMSACGGGSSDSGDSGSAAAAQIPLATGSGIDKLADPQGKAYDITAYGAVAGGAAVANQLAINKAIDAAAAAGGGIVVVPAGTFKTYSIRLKSNVSLNLATKTSILQAAVSGTAAGQDGGFYDAPEQNLFVGLQDQGHSHFENSLIYGENVNNVMIFGPGMIDGSYLDATSGTIVNVLSGNDPAEVSKRTDAGVPGFGNKAIAMVNSKNIAFRDFTIKNGGHFAIIGSGVVGWTMDGLLVDTNRDALDVDASQNVTIRNSTFNSLTDDAIVLKASFGVGSYFPTKNVLIEHCTVSGYDAGSVIAGTPKSNKIVANDRDGPTARIKLGTEGTTGFDTITVRDIKFERSRGFALESVDGAELKNIVFTDSTMTNVASSPIFIRLGDRGRAPVTGNSATDEATAPTNNVRLDDRGWILPNLAKYSIYPAVRFIPSYDKTVPAQVGNASTPFNIVNQAAPTKLNAYSIKPTDPLYANAVGVGFAKVHDIKIDNIKVTDADPRYPILIAGLVDHPIQNVSISNVSVQYRGGLKMEHAIEQRQLNQTITYTQFQAATTTQSVPWLVNTFFSKAEGLLPRISWDPAASAGAGAWSNDPYNIPEMPREYPEPSIFGVLPSYGIYARHVKGLIVDHVSLSYAVEDERPAVVLDDVDTAKFSTFTAQVKSGTPVFVKVKNTKKRDADFEYVLNYPYKSTQVSNLTIPDGMATQEVTVSRPAPGTPSDTLYTYPTAPSTSYPYSYAVPDASYPLPKTVHPEL